MAFFDQFKETFSSAALAAGKKVRSSTEVVKVSGEIRVVKGEIRRFYEELGRTIYESKGQDMDTCREICEKIDARMEKLDALTRRDQQIRRHCPACNAVMNKKAKFCSACGAAMPENKSEE